MISFHHSRLLHTAIDEFSLAFRLGFQVHIINAHASREYNFAMWTILGKGFPQALVHTVHSTCAFGTRACGKPFPKIVPMAKLDIPSQGLKLYNLRTLATCILKKNARRHKIDCQTRFVCHQIGLERQRCDERDLNAYSFFFNTLFFLVNFPRFNLSPNTQSCNMIPLSSTFRFENLRSPKKTVSLQKNSKFFSYYVTFQCGLYSV